jgi:hypothetical protein
LQVFLNFPIIGAPTKADNAGQPSLNVHNLQKLEHAPTLLSRMSTSPIPNAYRIPPIRTPTCLSPNHQLTKTCSHYQWDWGAFKNVFHITRCLNQGFFTTGVGRRGGLGFGLDGL